MNIQPSIFSAILALAVLAHGVNAAVQDEPLSPVWQKIDPAWTEVSDKIVAFLGEDKQKLLADLAYAAVAGDLCQGLKLDRKTFQSDFDSNFDKPADQATSPAHLTQYGQKVAMFFGVYVGLLTAVGMQERDSFCGAALEMLAKGEGRYWQAVDAAKPGAQGNP